MPTAVRCPHCGKEGKIPDEFLARRIRCAGCSQTFHAGDAAKQAAATIAAEADAARLDELLVRDDRAVEARLTPAQQQMLAETPLPIPTLEPAPIQARHPRLDRVVDAVAERSEPRQVIVRKSGCSQLSKGAVWGFCALWTLLCAVDYLATDTKVDNVMKQAANASTHVFWIVFGYVLARCATAWDA